MKRDAVTPSLRSLAPSFATIALANVTREFPYAPGHIVLGPDDMGVPRAAHPAFYGSFDWHSSVHMHWLLVRLLREHGDVLDDVAGGRAGGVAGVDAGAGAVTAVLDEHLSTAALVAEAEYLRRDPSFERPYGWAWLLALAAEATAAAEGARSVELAGRWAAALAPCVDVVEALVLGWLPRLTHPVRHGTHANTAFAAGLMLDAAETLGRSSLAGALRDAVGAWFVDDRDYPAAWEPSGEDFLSGAMTEADAVRRVLDGDALAGWLARFLPGLADGSPRSLLAPVTVSDPRDGRIGHLHGLNLSRAAGFRSVGAALPAGDGRRAVLAAAADRHLTASMPAVSGGGYLGDHWLATFAALALDSPSP